MKNQHLKNMVTAAMFMAIGVVLPFLTGQIKQFGSALLPMHLPILLCGFICGWRHGLAVGLITPVLRSFMFGMPALYPDAVSMAFELAVYGFVSGFLYWHLQKKNIVSLYICIIIAMIAGRIVWGLSQVFLIGAGGETFTFAAFTAGAFINAFPGIVLQLIIIPIVMVVLEKTKFLNK